MASTDAEVLAICEDVWNWRLAESPELSSFCGIHQYDDKWDDISEEAYIKREKCVREFLKKVESMDITSCSEEIALSHTLLLDDLRLYLQGTFFKSYLMPISFLEGIHVDCNLTISYMKFHTEEDFNKYISRLEKLPLRIERVIQVLKRGVKERVVLFYTSIMKVPKQIDELLQTPLNDFGLLKPFTEDHQQVPKDQLDKFQVTAKDLITSTIFPAFRKLKIYIEEEYTKHMRPHEGISTLVNGTHWYQQCLDFHLSCSMTPQQVHDLGLKEVQRIQKQILVLAEKEQLGQTLPEILSAITSKQENLFKSRDDVLDYVKNLCYERIRPKISQMFKKLPDIPVKIQPTPDYMKNGPGGYYLNGTPDGSREGVYYINNHNIKECLPYQLPALSLHEGEPGHHLQAIYSLVSSTLPDFRRYAEDSKYYLAPARFSLHTAHIEGWGLYSEALGEELNVYQDNLELLGRYSYEIFRAARLVVDTGLHAFGWGRDKAIKYMVENTLTIESEVTKEVDRYINWPGQACAYKVGEIKIWELRHKAEEKLGSQFDVTEFHHRILSCGAVPLRVLETIIDKYIKEVKSNT